MLTLTGLRLIWERNRDHAVASRGDGRGGELTTPAGAELPEAAYYQTIEETFVSRRGDPLFLSNADWTLIHKWRQAGIPLRIVLRGIADALDGHAHSWGRARKVGSLAYCAAEVDAARERWERALAAGGEPDADPVLAPLGAGGRVRRRARCREAASSRRELRDPARRAWPRRVLEPWLMEREAAPGGAAVRARRGRMDRGGSRRRSTRTSRAIAGACPNACWSRSARSRSRGASRARTACRG